MGKGDKTKWMGKAKNLSVKGGKYETNQEKKRVTNLSWHINLYYRMLFTSSNSVSLSMIPFEESKSIFDLGFLKYAL